MSDTATPRDPILDDPPGTEDKRVSAADQAAMQPHQADDRRIAWSHETCRYGGVMRPATGKSEVDGSRRYECTECDYKARVNWAWWGDS